MTVPTPSTITDHTDVAKAAERLLKEMADDDFGDFSASLYETARLVALAPWLDGHAQRLRFLCDTQTVDGKAGGSWGETGHRLVPTLSATEALLTTLARPDPPAGAPSRSELTRTAQRGLEHLATLLAGPAARTVPLPDTVAIELIVPALAARINEHLNDPGPALGSLLPDWCAGLWLELPPGCEPEFLARLRQTSAHSLPEKLWHCWEAIAPVGERTPHVRLVGGGLCCSPAATATWLGEPEDAHHPSARYLRRVQERHGGPVPAAAPLDTFEIAWALTIFADPGVPHTPPPSLLERLRSALTEAGAPGGAGLPLDADVTAVVLHVLTLHGQGPGPEALMLFFCEDHFFTYPGERTASTSTNAHALDALLLLVTRHPEHRARHGPVIDKVTDWLLEHQHQDGYWTDKWHGSPYYATACCARALATGDGRRTAAALTRAASWAVATQKSNGRWGHGPGTLEETAYATWIINGHDVPGAGQALDAAHTALRDGDPTNHSPPLWYDKDLYTPHRIVRAAHVAALHALDQRPSTLE